MTATTQRPARRAPQRASRRNGSALVLLTTVLALNVVGLVMVMSASSVNALESYGSSWHFFQRQVLFTVIGVVALFVAARMDYRAFQRLATPLLLVAAGLLLVVLVPGIGVEVAGSRRWIPLGPINVQPSELAKLALLVSTADVLVRRGDLIEDWREVLRPVLLVAGGFALLVMKEPDMGTTVVLGIIVATLLFAGGVRLRQLVPIGGVALAAAAVLALSAPYRRARVFAFLDPFADPERTGYQAVQSLIALGSGGLFGVGLGASRAKWLFLPNAHTDFVFAIIGEELGLVGALLVVALFVALAFVGVRTAVHAPDRFGYLLALGITVWMVGQAVINIGATIGLVPITGVPLPFVSFGGSALVVNMFATGILLNIARQGRARPVLTPEPVFALVTGGGTGGHVYPALALAEELVARGRAVRFVGARRGLEATAVPAAGFGIDLLPGRGLQRRLAWANVGAVVGAVAAFFRAWRIVGRWRPSVVVGVGGYASLPCVLAARLRRRPVVVHEQNAAPGLANRIAVRLGAVAAVSLPGTPLAGARLVGNPVRAAMARVACRPDPEPLVLAFGGSLGSRRINEAVVGLARVRPGLRIRHVSGRRDHASCVAATAGLGGGYELVEYEEHMDEWYGRASVVVARAGAVTVAELAVAGVPSVLVPLPGAPGDHQTRNALALVEAGAAVLVPDAECTAERLAGVLDGLLGDPGRLERMGEAARSLGRPDAAARLADLVEEAAR